MNADVPSIIRRVKNWEWPNCVQLEVLSKLWCVSTDIGQGTQDRPVCPPRGTPGYIPGASPLTPSCVHAHTRYCNFQQERVGGKEITCWRQVFFFSGFYFISVLLRYRHTILYKCKEYSITIWLDLESSWSDYKNQFSEYPSFYIDKKLKKKKK